MAFSTLQFSGAVSGSSGYLTSSGTFTATITGNADGSVGGTWSFSGTYRDTSPYYPNSGSEAMSGTLTGSGGAAGPWTITLAGGRVENGTLTLSFANGQYSLAVHGGFAVDYTVTGGYDSEVTYHDHHAFAAQLTLAGTGPAGSATDGNDNLTGTAAGDSIAALAGNDTISGAAGNDTVDGGSGVDVAVFGDARANYTVTHSGSTWTVSHSGGVDADTLTNVERLQFADARLAIDIDGHGGQAYRLYQAAFDRVPDIAGFGYQMNELDKGFSLSQVAAAFIASPEFQAKYGGAVDDTAFITLLYRNVLDREPEAAGLQFHLDELAAGETRADLLTHFSESPENQANVLGSISAGMLYVL